ncbi:MAG: 16S rRNA (cytidine(1402)-2'-O)-methyltransferase [Betaproteobacteria bacterium]|nr:16S rRNA (cytidine(1402)-2'-O)-methyltransferase [Betaproteobacteria bacterium]
MDGSGKVFLMSLEVNPHWANPLGLEAQRPQHFPAASLLVVGTPIGNLSDLSPRAAQALTESSLLACEDPRVSRKLFDALGLRPRLLSIEQHREAQSIPDILEHLRQGGRCALISDAGTPAISDPGHRVVQAVRSEGFVVIPIPGPSAFVALASVSGFSPGPIWFEGFLPQREQAASTRLERLLGLNAHLALYEAPHRITKTAAMLAARAPLRKLCIGRELTKRFEESAVMLAKDLPDWLMAQSHRDRGEFALFLESERSAFVARCDKSPDSNGSGASHAFTDQNEGQRADQTKGQRADQNEGPPAEDTSEDVELSPSYSIQGRALLEALLAVMAPAQAARLAQRLSKDRKTDWYQMAMQLKSENQ